MSLLGLMEHRLTISRMKSGAGIQRIYQSIKINQPCLIQPVTAEYAAKTNQVFGRSYNCFLPIGTDVEISDKAVDQDGKEYRVTGTLKRNYGRNPHLTVWLTEQSKNTPDQ